jgi:carbon monoxide dehydrogenase subunit G
MANTVNIYVNKADIGLDLVDNTSDLNKPISTATQTALNGKEDVSNKSTNTSLGTSDTLYPSQKAVKTYVDTAVSGATIPTLDQVTTSGAVTDNSITVANVTFSNTMTSSEHAVQRLTTNKKVSIKADGEIIVNTNGNFEASLKATNLTANVNIELPNKAAGTYTLATTDIIGAANGVAELDGAGKVPSSQLPSYVDDVEEYANLAAFPVTGESGKIYIALDTNLTYRWGGTAYVEISPSLALGETSSSAYRGDRGKIAYDHSLLTSGNPHNVTKSDVGLSNVVNSDTTTTANITDSSNKRFVTDAQLTVIGNTSGTNTGDQDLSGLATKNLTLDRKTASYTLVSGDNNKLIEMNVGTANNVTINNSVFSAGNQILVSQYGAGQVTFVAGAGVTLRSPSGKLKLTGQYSLATIIAISATEFYISGDLTA